MTSLDPSHIPGLSKKPRTGQAVHDPSQTTEADVEEKAEFPDEVSDIDSDAAELRARKEGKRKIRSAVPAIPDLRFEQVGGSDHVLYESDTSRSLTCCRSDRS